MGICFFEFDGCRELPVGVFCMAFHSKSSVSNVFPMTNPFTRRPQQRIAGHRLNAHSLKRAVSGPGQPRCQSQTSGDPHGPACKISKAHFGGRPGSVFVFELEIATGGCTISKASNEATQSHEYRTLPTGVGRGHSHHDKPSEARRTSQAASALSRNQGR